MSNKSTATDYVKSYVGNNTTSEDYLSQQQPRYDPSKPIAQPQTTPLEQDPAPPATNTEASEHWKMHLPTQNPIPTAEKQGTATAESQTQQQAQQQEQPEIVWAARDFKEQRSEIHETSLTVCADLHENLMTCFKDGSWWDKAKMCEDQKQKFWTCYNTQKKFLKGVNYKGPVTTEKENNQILLKAYQLRDQLEKSSNDTKKED